MSFIPDEELKSSGGITLAPMIDFLFLMLVFFASMAISRVATKDTDIALVKIEPEQQISSVRDERMETKVINLSITKDNEYKWVTEVQDYKMKDAAAVATELKQQYEQGLLPQEFAKTQVLVKIDKDAQWEPILALLFAVRDTGFTIRPVYEPKEDPSQQMAQVKGRSEGTIQYRNQPSPLTSTELS